MDVQSTRGSARPGRLPLGELHGILKTVWRCGLASTLHDP